MESVTKKIFNLILIIIAIISLLITSPISPSNPEILVLSGIILFVFFTFLITQHPLKLEEELDTLKEIFKINERLSKMKNEIAGLKWLN
jgi:c-di-AMP phosphodiesterase-like protein|tara:strand:+ start:2591 stop:2857 length:267 start_codon:yes stop_codon:yes gene_type:complete